LAQVDVPPSATYDKGALINALGAVVYNKEIKAVFVDLRGSDLTPQQITDLRKAMRPMIWGRKSTNVFLIEDARVP
jgi:hypothetical protein